VPLPAGAHGRHPDELAVVIPTRDRWPLLRTAVATALAQEDVDAHVLVVDDGSVDQTAGALEALGDPRVLVLRNDRPKGVSAARNVGLSHTSAPWIAFLDDDDVWAPGYLAAMLDAVRASEVDLQRTGLVYSGHLVVDRGRNVTGVSPPPPLQDVRDRMDKFNFVGCPSRVVLRTQAVRDAGGFDARLSILADWDLWVRILAERGVVRCPELLVGYMLHAGNMHLDGDRLLAELAVMQHKYGWDRGLRQAGDMLPSFVAEAYRATGRRLRAARWYLRAFRVQRTRRDLGRAIGVLLGERFIELSGLRKHEAIDPSIGGWLEHVREAERATTTGLPPLPGVHRNDAGHPGGYAAR
jgi:glycosyltransferase involved in cell wall biosynthesis